jgi:peptidoglycan/LPS O-acetylase OafA/YrhL
MRRKIRAMEAVAASTTNEIRALHAKSSYRPEIDGLRALAVVAVIINHFEKSIVPSGYLGVDIFFVISGFVITSSLADSTSKNLSDFLMQFYARRIKRLVPALVLFVIVTGILICLFDPSPGISLRTGITALFGLSNLLLLRQSTDYFATSTEFNVFIHTWSLGVEEQFYLLYPTLFWVSGFLALRTNGSGKLFWLITALSVASLIGFVYLYPINQPAAYFLMPFRFWELGVGCLLFLALRRPGKLLRNVSSISPLLVTAALVAVLFVPLEFAVPATVAAVALTALLIACLRPGVSGYGLFTSGPVLYVGLISYSLYLWHWSVLSLSRWTIGIHWWSAPFLVVLMLLLSSISYRFVETPLRRSQWSLLPWRSIAYGMSASAIVAVVLIGLGKPFKGYLYAGERTAIEERYLSLATTGNTSECNIFEVGTAAAELRPECGSNEFEGRPTVYLFGDSHMQQFASAIAASARTNRLNYRVIWGNSCFFPAAVVRAGYVNRGGRDRTAAYCLALQRQVASSALEKIRDGDVVFFANDLGGDFSNEIEYVTEAGETVAGNAAARIFSDHLRAYAEKLVGRRAKVVVYLGGVRFTEDTVEGLCQKQWFRPSLSSDCWMDPSGHLQDRETRFGWVFRWADGVSRFAWDGLDEQTCSKNRCSAAHFSDSNHFTKYYANYIFTKFLERHPGVFH